MCGRYTLSSTPARINSQFSVTIETDWTPSYNIAPGTNVLMIHGGEETDRVGETAYWGFTPSWVKPGGRGPRPINARSEGVGSKPMFKSAFTRRRCILPADGFYEWKRLDGGKQPWLIRRCDNSVFGFAGIYEPGNDITGNQPSCAILTTAANSFMRHIHERMPVILRREDYAAWLDAGPLPSAHARQMLRACGPDDLLAYPVSRRVNNVKNNDESLVQPLDATMSAPDRRDATTSTDRG